MSVVSEEYSDLMLDRAFEHKLEQQEEKLHNLNMSSDREYAIEYVIDRYQLADCRESLRSAIDYLNSYGYELSLNELFEDIS